MAETPPINALINNGKIDYKSTQTYQNESKRGTSELGKDAFLTLLTTQMKYQDPMEPSSDTEFIGQLAQFSSLEAMENVESTISNQTAHSLVGKNVIVAVGSSKGATQTYIGGYVDYTEIKDGVTNLCIDGNLYNIADLYSVVDEKYLNNIPEK